MSMPNKIPLDEQSVTRKQLADPANVRAMADPRLRASLESARGCGELDPGAYVAITKLEDTLARSRASMPFLLEDELVKNGAHFKKRLLPFTSHVEVDGKLITGQNPQSARAVGERLVEQLAR